MGRAAAQVFIMFMVAQCGIACLTNQYNIHLPHNPDPRVTVLDGYHYLSNTTATWATTGGSQYPYCLLPEIGSSGTISAVLHYDIYVEICFLPGTYSLEQVQAYLFLSLPGQTEPGFFNFGAINIDLYSYSGPAYCRNTTDPAFRSLLSQASILNSSETVFSMFGDQPSDVFLGNGALSFGVGFYILPYGGPVQSWTVGMSFNFSVMSHCLAGSASTCPESSSAGGTGIDGGGTGTGNDGGGVNGAHDCLSTPVLVHVILAMAFFTVFSVTVV